MARMPAHVKIYVTISSNERMCEPWADPMHRGILTEIMRLGMAQFSAKKGDRVQLMSSDRIQVGGQDLEIAEDRIEAACKLAGWRIDRRPNRWTVTVRNFAKKQGIRPIDTDYVSGDSGPDTETPERREKREEGRRKNEEGRKGFELTPSAPPSPPNLSNAARDAWPLIRAAFLEYGRDLTEILAGDRLDLIRKRLEARATPEDLVRAVHGYVRFHRGLEPDGEFDPRKFFRPETIFTGKGFEDRVERGKETGPIPPRPTGNRPTGAPYGDWDR